MSRIPLTKPLRLQNENGLRDYEIRGKPIGRGGSCLVYTANTKEDPTVNESQNDEALARTNIIKEFYPEALQYSIDRGKDGALDVDDGHKDRFDELKSRFVENYRRLVRFHNDQEASLGSTIYAEAQYEANNTSYIVMELSAGGTLDASRHWCKTLYDISSVICQLAGIVQKYHEYEGGWLHLDLKPANVYWHKPTGDRDRFRLSLFDFDSAQRISRIQDNTDTLLYSEDWAAPELAKKDRSEIGRWTDIFSIGAIIYWLLTGDKYDIVKDGIFRRKPWNAETLSDKLKNIDHCCVRLIEKILGKTLRINPANRYQRIDGEFQSDLERLREYSGRRFFIKE